MNNKCAVSARNFPSFAASPTCKDVENEDGQQEHHTAAAFSGQFTHKLHKHRVTKDFVNATLAVHDSPPSVNRVDADKNFPNVGIRSDALMLSRKVLDSATSRDK